ncbi:MAG: sigma-70 family RNA polymerase sigma factor [Phycisphaerae bacterium]|jgi:RNA polymerase sigma-70 factor (ECF subfamily)
MDGLEAELVSQAVDGDRAAIQRLLTRLHTRLASSIEKKLPADLQGLLSADDVCQEAYVAVFQRIGNLNDRSPAAFRAWVRAVTERKLVDMIRALRAQKRGGGKRVAGQPADADLSSVVDLLDIVAQHEHTPSRSVRRREMVSGVHKALDGLKVDYRDALRMHYLEGLSVGEVAKRMERTPGAVVMLCNRALKQLAERIGDPTGLLSQDA